MLASIYDMVIAGDVQGVEQGVEQALKQGEEPKKIINEALIKAMDEVGKRMHSGDMFVPEVLIAAESMKAGLGIVKPLIGGDSSYVIGKVVLGTVAGDLHDIGKNLVGMLLESSGFEVIDLGTDVTTEAFVTAVENNKPQLVGMSALLTTTMSAMAETVKALKGKGLAVKIIVGGAPVSNEFAVEIGADGYASDGAAAVQLAKRLIN